MSGITITHNPACGTSRKVLVFIWSLPVLPNRPIVATPLGVRLCRPSEGVFDILPRPQQGPFSKEGVEAVIDAKRRCV